MELFQAGLNVALWSPVGAPFGVVVSLLEGAWGAAGIRAELENTRDFGRGAVLRCDDRDGVANFDIALLSGGCVHSNLIRLLRVRAVLQRQK